MEIIRWLLLMGPLLAGQVDRPAEAELKLEVGRLVRQLDAPTLDEREAAEAELLGAVRPFSIFCRRLANARRRRSANAPAASDRSSNVWRLTRWAGPRQSLFTPTPCRS